MLSFINFFKKTRFNLPSPIVVITDFLIIFWKKSFKEFIKTLRFCNSTVESLPHQGSLQSLLHHVYLEPTKPMFMKPHSSWMSRNISIWFSRKQGSVPFSFPNGMFLRQVFYKISSRINFALAFSKQAAISKVEEWLLELASIIIVE